MEWRPKFPLTSPILQALHPAGSALQRMNDVAGEDSFIPPER